jgi:hypothetical protein
VDFFHSPPGTEHIFVGAGEEPCVILMTGARLESEELHYPVSELAARYGASVEEETSDFEDMHPRFEPSRAERPSYWGQLPGRSRTSETARGGLYRCAGDQTGPLSRYPLAALVRFRCPLPSGFMT